MFSVTFLWAESPWGRARADCHELVAGLCGRREATRPAGAPGGSGQASFSKSRMVWGGSVSAVGAPSSPVQRELRERAARKGRPLTLRTGTSVWKLACPAWGSWGAPYSIVAPRRLVGRLGLERGVGEASGRSLLATSPQGGRPASLDSGTRLTVRPPESGAFTCP